MTKKYEKKNIVRGDIHDNEVIQGYERVLATLLG